MHEVIFHFPCSIGWHGKAAGLCPRSSCISSPGKRFLRASGQILSTPARPSGSGRIWPGSFSCTWAPGRREPRCYVPLPPVLLLSSALGSSAAGPGGVGPAQRRCAPGAAWSHSAPYWARAVPPASHRGSAALRGGGGSGGCDAEIPSLLPIHERGALGCSGALHPCFPSSAVYPPPPVNFSCLPCVSWIEGVGCEPWINSGIPHPCLEAGTAARVPVSAARSRAALSRQAAGLLPE